MRSCTAPLDTQPSWSAQYRTCRSICQPPTLIYTSRMCDEEDAASARPAEARKPYARVRYAATALPRPDHCRGHRLRRRQLPRRSEHARLGSELGVEAMSLYRYFPSKAALLDGVVCHALHRPGAAGGRAAATGSRTCAPTHARFDVFSRASAPDAVARDRPAPRTTRLPRSPAAWSASGGRGPRRADGRTRASGAPGLRHRLSVGGARSVESDETSSSGSTP